MTAAAPIKGHPLGTDNLGQDTLSRLFYGARVSLSVGVIVEAIELLIGVSLAWAGRDSLSGAILLDSKLGVQARPGMTARFVAGRSQRLSSAP